MSSDMAEAQQVAIPSLEVKFSWDVPESIKILTAEAARNIKKSLKL